jgi:hypothetical protein
MSKWLADIAFFAIFVLVLRSIEPLRQCARSLGRIAEALEELASRR